jgi:hypothetical protein
VPPASSLVGRIALVALVALAMTLASASASAEPERPEPSPAVSPRPTYVRVPGAAKARTGTTTANVTSRIVYLKRCPLGGCVVKKGTDDARTDTTSIAEGATGASRIIGEFSQGDEVWNGLVDCVKTTFAPFDITITATDPGDVPHFMNIVGGKPTQLNSEFPSAGGIAPFDCGEIANAVVFTFDVYGPSVSSLCWTSAQEIAHAFGLEHEFLQKDPLTYIDGDLPKRFRDVDAQCGEREVTSCKCPRTKQNTYRHIVEMFGPGAPTPPEVAFSRPVDGKTVQPGFKAVIHTLDEVRVDKVELYADGMLLGTSTMPVGIVLTQDAVQQDVFEIVAPELGRGEHSLEVRSIDVQGVAGTQTINVTEGPPCTPSKGCDGMDVCVAGVCVPGPDVAGGLGYGCSSDNECLSHRCADGGEGLKHCVEACSVGNASSCPSGFSCLAAGAAGVCWPESGGCCDAGARPHGPVLLSLGVLLVLRRRKRRP